MRYDQLIRLTAAVAFAVPLAACGEGSFIPTGPQAERESEPAAIIEASAIVEQADVPTVDPSRLTAAEIAKALGGPAACLFRYTPDGAPVVAVDATRAVVKVNGDMVILDAASGTDPRSGAKASSGPVAAAIDVLGRAGWGVPDELPEANLRFVIGEELNVGYAGYYDCGA